MSEPGFVFGAFGGGPPNVIWGGTTAQIERYGIPCVEGKKRAYVAITEPTGLTSVPWVDMRVGCDAIPEGDSVLVRVEHHWAAPDEGPAAPYVEALSDSHFWVVDGTWEDGTPGAPHLDARLTYVGNDENDLDHGLYGDTEEGGFLAWRPLAGAPWVQHPHYTWQAGSLANGSGVFKIAKLLKVKLL